MIKLMLSSFFLLNVSLQASEPVKTVAQVAKPVVIKTAVDKTVGAFKLLTGTKLCKFFTDNRITNTITQDEYVQKAWADKLGKSLLCAAPFYAMSLYEANKDKKSYSFKSTNWFLVGALVQATTYAHLNK